MVAEAAATLPHADTRPPMNFRISVVAMTGAVIVIENASAADTILSVKQRVFAANRKLHVHRQSLMYRPGPRGIEPLADDDTLGGAGVAQDGSAEFDVLLTDLSEYEVAILGPKLLAAAENGHTSELCEVMDQGADLESRDGREYTALILAAEQGHPECVRVLLEGGADTEAVNVCGETALFWAAMMGRTECVRLLLEGGADTFGKTSRGYTALMCAARGGHADCVRVLMEGGVDTEATDHRGMTALVHARAKGHYAIAEFLTET